MELAGDRECLLRDGFVILRGVIPQHLLDELRVAHDRLVETQARLDPYLTRQLAEGWRLSRLDATVRAILRAGLYEMIRRPDVPYKVVINEYVEIARAFFDGDEPGFINAVLDAAAKQARSDEVTL